MPLSIKEHLICLSIGMFSLVWGLFVRLIPDSLFGFIKIDEEEMKGSKKSLLASVRRTPPSVPSINKDWRGIGKN